MSLPPVAGAPWANAGVIKLVLHDKKRAGPARAAREFESGADYSDAPREINSCLRRMMDRAGYSG